MDEFSQKSMNTLELDKILARLGDLCTGDGAKARAAALQPLSTRRELEQSLDQTAAAMELAVKKGNPSFFGVRDLRPQLMRAERGGVLTMGDLLAVGSLLRAARTVRDYRFRDGGDGETCLDELFDLLRTDKTFEGDISSAILAEDEMADSASPALASIRRRIGIAQNRVRDVLARILSSPARSKYLRENLITQRAGRFVVPVKAENRRDVPGLVHDVSSSGATVFVEPMGVVEANNEIAALLAEENAEIERILAEFTARTFERKDALETDYRLLTELDFIFARAKLALAMDAYRPRINEDGFFDLRRARHPLLDPKTVVPVDITLGAEYNTLIITGPNTGGKTVALKTLGLLTLMALCGLHIPADEGSAVPRCGAVFADIGDEQSIEQSLSTFSAHMKNIVAILEKTGPDTLVLFDELGAGTDPTEGAALAIAIIERAASRGARIAATTHYAELKVYALNTPGVENACCEFDVETLRPTYRLLTGVPGRSNAFAISKRLGLPDEVIEHARGLIDDESLKFEDVIDRLEESRVKTEQERAKAEALRREIEELGVKAREREKHFDEERARFTASARAEGDRILAETRSEAAALIDEIRAVLRDRNADRIDLNAMHADVNRRLNELEAKARRSAAADQAGSPADRPERDPEVGETVHIRRMNADAVVLKKPADGSVAVQAGILKMTVPLSDVVLIPQKKPQAPTASVTVKKLDLKEAAAAYRCDLRGMSSDEALAELDLFVNRAVMQHFPAATIVHGKGTGKLRAAVQDYLRHSRFVKSYRLGVYGEGDSGVTVVEFRGV